MTPADTIIVECIHYGIAFVYHSGMFAYACETDLDYCAYVNFRNFPGKLDAERGNFNFEDNKLKLIDINTWEK